MGRRRRSAVGMIGVLLIVGCRTATHVTEIPRVDLDLSTGNRGYLVGHPPEAAQLKTTRQIVQTDIEIPSWYQPTHGGTAVIAPEQNAPAETAMESTVPSSSGVVSVPDHYDTYVVQKGESLWTIAAKPEIYGKATRWRRIFDANRELLKTPDRVRAGMKLKIPRGKGTGVSSGDEGTTFKK